MQGSGQGHKAGKPERGVVGGTDGTSPEVPMLTVALDLPSAQILADQKQCQKQGEQRIEYAQEEVEAWFGIEVVKALLKRLPEIFNVNPADSDLAR